MKTIEIGTRVRLSERLRKLPYLIANDQNNRFMRFIDKEFVVSDMNGDILTLTAFEDENVKVVIEREYVESISELNLVELLKDCPRGTKFYHSTYGYMRFAGIEENTDYPVIFLDCKNVRRSFTKGGFIYDGISYPDAECQIYLSKEMRDWSKWVCPKPDLPIDTPVMVQNTITDWRLRYYAGNKNCWDNAHKSTDCIGFVAWKHIIPFDKFNPNDIEESLKYDICRKD